MRFDGTIYDCGTKIGFLLANVAFALERDELAPRAQGRDPEARLNADAALVAETHAELHFLDRVVAVDDRRVEGRVLIAAEQHGTRGER